MSIKVIAIGNTLMEDDGIAIAVIENIRAGLEEKNVEVIVGETDFNYCISMINDEDLLLIIDAASYGGTAGEINTYDIGRYNSFKKGYTQHSYHLIDLLHLYFTNLKGFVIGIQINSVSFKLGLSKVLESKLKNVSIEVEETINYLISKYL
ncbi:hydrogenase maturation protease [Clostridium sp. A1-XYC3]|uniref:Hydrogenase maturation protease n=1 Tax=Clostridium tanneri TaxID=3037988 RepID=A0ABU4JYW5_9CLOT|nr:hydrogenase maturation protease [Clostridium sp. A1-XYC3]MDW8803106.1 hydrogenase maturation protease [Clostridium sp. A1-XYC3]